MRFVLKSMTIMTAVLAVALAVGMTGCESAGSGSGGGGGTDVETISWEDDGNGYYQYKTNDSEKTDSIQLASFTNDDVTTGATLEVETQKLSGAPEGLYGVVFGRQESGNFYLVAVNYDKTNRLYDIRKYENGTFESLLNGAQSTSGIDDSANSITMRITRTNDGDGDGNSYDSIMVEFRTGGGSYIEQATVSDDSFGLGAKGFAAGIASSSMEDFPDTPVDTRFKMLEPVELSPSVSTSGVGVPTIYGEQ